MKTEIFVLWFLFHSFLAILLLAGWMMDADLFRRMDGTLDLSLCFGSSLLFGIYMFFGPR